MQCDLALEDTRPPEMIAAIDEEARRVRDAGAAIIAALDGEETLRLDALDAAVRLYALEDNDNSDGAGDWCEYTLAGGGVRLLMDYSCGIDRGATSYTISLSLSEDGERTRRTWSFDAEYRRVPGWEDRTRPAPRPSQRPNAPFAPRIAA